MSMARSMLAGLVGMMAVSVCTAATNVCGPINSNTTWNLAGQPYIVTCDVVVMPGATLTIDPGVSVLLRPNTRLKAQGGQIVAIGTPLNPIQFFSDDPMNDPPNPAYGIEVAPSGVTGGTFTYCLFKQMTYGISIGCCGGVVPVVVNNCRFDSNITGIGGYNGQPAQINFSSFTNNTFATDTADKIFQDCSFAGNGSNMQGVERITLRRCNINGGVNGVVGSGNAFNVFVYDTTITNTTLAVFTPTAMERCKITGNSVGLKFNTPPTSLQCNDIFGNFVWNVESQSPTTVSFANNWWGTTTPSVIDAGIKDGFDMSGLGFVQYTPILTGPFSSGPCNCVLPTSTPASPATMTKFSGKPASFSVTGGGTGPLSYQWFRNGVPLTNTGRVSGVNSATLNINPLYLNGGDPSWTDAGQYSCVVTNLCGSATSAAATLTVNNCFADVNQNGSVTVQDLFDFLAGWFAGCP